MKRIVFIYARSDSQRLPGKPMMFLAGHRLIDIVAARAGMVGAEGCALLTSDRPVDDALAEHGSRLGLQVVRGHATDLVMRTVQGLQETGATHFLRANADSPFLEPQLAKFAMPHLNEYSIISNLLIRKFPYGIAIEWVEAGFFHDRAGTAEESELEHVTKHLYRQLNEIKALCLTQARNDTDLRLVIDTPADHAQLTKLIGDLDVLTSSYWVSCGLSEPDLRLNIY